jgi:hypothetical protein
MLVLSAWCGLFAGSPEVSTIVFRKQVFDPNHLYKMSRHFVWLIPLSNVFVFVELALLGGSIILIWPRHGRWMSMRILCAITLLPCVLVAFSPNSWSSLVYRDAGDGRAARSAR